jgi:membrane-bound lytic murein transglycosylase D
MTAKVAPLIISFCLVIGCAADKMLAPSVDNHHRSSTPLVIQEPIKIESGTVALKPNSGKVAGEAAKRPVVPRTSDQQTGPERATLAQFPEGQGTDQQKKLGRGLDSKKTDVTKPPFSSHDIAAQGQELSVVVRNDDADDDISSLFTPDYLRQFDIPIVFNDAVQYYVRYFTTEKRKVFTNWLRRSHRYVPMIRQILREHGLPEDLIYLAMIESGFNPKAYSSMKACGPWQFIYETGGRYGLKVNHWVDERRDPEKSTVAAALYLKDLFNQFGNWYLAAAGYNAGEKRIEKAVEKHETTDFWEITKYNTLPRETRDYIPKLLAAAIIAKDPDRFGFINMVYDQPIQFIAEKVPGGTPMTVISRAASVDLTALRGLNPEILTGVIPPDVTDYVLKLPESLRKDRFREELGAALDKEKRLQDVIIHVCKRRDSLGSILKRYKVTNSDLLLVNSCDQELFVGQGRVIYVPRFSASSDSDETRPTRAAQAMLKVTEGKEADQTEEERSTKRKPRVQAAVVEHAQKTDYHVVKKGESLAGISEKYGIDLDKLKEINKLKKTQLYPNMRLELTSHATNESKRVRNAVYHVVKKGDTLSGIADKYDVDMVTLKEMNGLKRNKVRYGMKLKVSSTKSKPAVRG